MWPCTTRLPGQFICCVARWIPCFWGPVSNWFWECYIQIRKVTPETFKVLQYTETEINNILELGALLLLGVEMARECHIYIRKLIPVMFKVLLFTKTLKLITFLNCEHGYYWVWRWPRGWASTVTVVYFLSYMDKRQWFLVFWAIFLY